MADKNIPLGPMGRSTDLAGKQKYSRYYSGTDIRIYLGDMWVDEIVEIEYTLQEQVAPIYGYGSYTWDKVARGNRYVQGSFSINFKEAGYLQTILDRLSSKQNGSKGVTFSVEDFNGTDDKKAIKNLSVEAIIKDFDSLASNYEQAIWGNKDSASYDYIKSRKTDSYFYGNRSKGSKNKTFQNNGFNILLTFGQSPDVSRTNSPDTVQSIIGVQLTGFSTAIDPSGNPVKEIYSFIAQDVNGNILSKANSK